MKSPTATKLPSGRWRVLVQIKGNRISITKDSKKEAERAAALLKMSPEKRITKMTYREGIDLYIEKLSRKSPGKVSPSTIKGYRDIQRTRFQSIMDLPMSADIDMQYVIDNEPVSVKTLQNAYGLISAVLRDIGIEPQKVEYPKEPKKERPFLNVDQVKIFCEAIKGDRYELPYLLCLHSLRRSEMLALKKSQVKDNVIHVEGAIVNSENGMIYKETNKTAASVRDIPIFIPRLSELIKSAPDGFLCPYSVRGMETHLRTILKHSGLPVSGFHMLRHGFASMAWAVGVDALTCMKLGGWSEYRTMIQIYTHLDEKKKQADVDKLKQLWTNE